MFGNVDRKQQLVIFILLAVVIFTAGYKISSWRGQPLKQDLDALVVTSQDQDLDNRQVMVHISGAVEKPGVYKVPLGSRVQDAVNRAISLPEADIQGLNLAAPLKDGQKLVVPVRLETTNTPTSVSKESHNIKSLTSSTISSSNPLGKLNINRASAKELEELPGLGPALVQRIINYRETQGMFTSEEDIKSVQGIGEKIYEKIKDNITVN